MKKKESPLNDLFIFLTGVPWWVGPVLAVMAFVGFRYLIPHFLFPEGSDGTMQESMKKGLAGFARSVAPILAGGILAIWAAAEAKKFINRRLLEKTENIDDVRNMTWQEFESLVGEAFRRRGYDVQETGSASGDGGIDLILERAGQRTAVQCKQWRNRQVGVKVARELYGSMADARATHGIIVCCGKFTADAEEFARRNGIELVTGRDLERLIVEAKSGYAAPPAASLRTVPASGATTKPGAASAPACPVCGNRMRIATGRTKFWGCTKYPDCKGTRQLK